MRPNYEDLDIRFIIISSGRYKTITSHLLFPYATLLVPEAQKECYAHVKVKDLRTVPDDIIGLGPLRNWVLRNFKEEFVVMIDDDIKHLWCISQEFGYKVTKPQEIYDVIESAALCAKDIGTSFFGFNQGWDVRKYKPDTPFKLTGWAGGVIGVVGRRHRFLQCNLFKVDIDFCLEVLLHDRVVWLDNRFSFVQIRESNKGGNSVFRTADKVRNELDILKRKWGRHFIHFFTPQGETVKLDVSRKNPRVKTYLS